MAGMRRLAGIVVLSAALLSAADARSADPGIGEPAADVQLHFLEGGDAQLGEWLGKQPVYMKIWATWCSTCRKEMPHFKTAYEKYGSDIAFFSVNAGFNDTVPEVRAFNEEYDLRMPSVIDRSGDIGEAFDLIATPYHILIDGDGRIVHSGHAANAAVDRVLARMAREGGETVVAELATATEGTEADLPAPVAGDPAPAFSVETLSGSMFSVDSHTGADRPVYLLFFTTWCESYLAGDGDDESTANACRETRETINAALGNSADPPEVIGIASRMWTGSRELGEYRDTVELRYPLALDNTNEIFRRYGVRGFPTLIVISDGRISSRHEGAVGALP